MFRFPFVVVAAFIVVASGDLRPPLAEAQEKLLPPEKAKVALLKTLDRPKVPADVKSDGEPVEKNELAYRKWSFASEKKADGTVERVPVYQVSPAGAKKKLPVMIVLHGTGGRKESVQSWLEDFAPFTLLHTLTVSVCLVLIAGACLLGSRIDPTVHEPRFRAA